MEGVLSSQLIVGYASAALIQFLKKQSWFPLASVDNAKLNRAFAAFTSLLAALAIHATFDSAAGVLTISGLNFTLVGLLHTVWAWVQQYAAQQAAYKGLIKTEVK
jgi:hypothetical protein